VLRLIYRVYIILFLFIPIFVTGVSGANETADTSSVIRVKDNLLTVKVRDMALEKVLMEIANQTPVKFEFLVSGDEVVIAGFSSLPVEKGLKRLLRDYNYTFIYDDSEKSKGREREIKKVIILSMAKGSRGRLVEPAIISTEEPSFHESLSEDSHNEDLDKLEEIVSEVIVDSLRDMLQDEDAEVRLVIVEEIATIGGAKAIQALEGALVDEDKDVRKMADEKLRQLEGE
jgi:hypothetical protein